MAQRRAAATLPATPLRHKLVLNRWLLGLFNVEKLEQLAAPLKSEALEGVDEQGISRFHTALTAQFFNLTQLSTALLLAYDERIVRHTAALNEARTRKGLEPIRWKYFQYLTLLFTEIYLDRYFTDPAALRAALNQAIADWNRELPLNAHEADRIAPYDEAGDPRQQLNKLAFWNATGSGKTLLMHVHLAQYRWYLAHHGRARELNRIILLTPNEGLSVQHLREFQAAGIEAEIFRKEGRGLFAGKAVEIIEVTRLVDLTDPNARKLGDKSVELGAFEGNNLVLVDEGHRGTAGGDGGAWLSHRDSLSRNGFSMEYSATFGQAVRDNVKLNTTYARAIAFDYSYRYFYADGFGKDYQILNLPNDNDDEWREQYLVAGLLTFYQQLRLWAEQGEKLRPFGLEKPLWIFVGGSVTASLGAREGSDIVQILLFLHRFVSQRTASIGRIRQLIESGLQAGGRDILANRFAYLVSTGLRAEAIYQDALARLFNAAAGGRLCVQNIKGATGEVAVLVGDNTPFGVVNVGDDAKLVKLCQEAGLDTAEREFGASLFHQLNQPGSGVNLLIGSRKFTEGWSSWRVSTMGLMNIGQGEGAQIIQLFGRGVRLKGYGMTLKRSSAIRQLLRDRGHALPPYLDVLETLSIFGIRANYMAEFNKYLQEEGLPTADKRTELVIPVSVTLPPATQPLYTIRLKRQIGGVQTDFGAAFRRLGPVPTLGRPTAATAPVVSELLTRNRVVLNWYPRIEALQSRPTTVAATAAPHETHFTAAHVALLDLDQLFFDLAHFKAERGWHNLNLRRDRLPDLLTDKAWYTLLIPESELAFDGELGRKLRRWQEIATALVRTYAERYYTLHKRAWEEPHLEYAALTADDPNLLAPPPGATGPAAQRGYRVQVDEDQLTAQAWFEQLRTQLAAGTFTADRTTGPLHALRFDQHLYQPLLAQDGKAHLAEISPVGLNEGERHFVEDLRAYVRANTPFFADKSLYALRNLSRGRGVGFFEAGNFFPDFLLWLQIGTVQHLIFVDPKGLRNLRPYDPKLDFYRTIKEIEARLADSNVHLHAYLVTETRLRDLEHLGKLSKEELTERHILLREEDRDTYIGTMVGRVVG